MARVLGEIKAKSGTVRFDFDDADLELIGPERVSRTGDRLVAQLDGSLEQALIAAKPAAEAAVNAFRSLTPERISVEFGLRLDASAGAVIAKAGVEAHFVVKLEWTPGELVSDS